MSESDPSKPTSEQDAPVESQRREALIKLGKYTAYATPILLATVRAAHAPPPPVGSGTPVSDIRVKMNIRPVGVLPNGLALYSYQYRHDPTTTYVGVLAQDLLKSDKARFRNAVIVRDDGYYAVRYDELGLKMFTLDEWRAVSAEMCRPTETFSPFVETGVRCPAATPLVPAA